MIINNQINFLIISSISLLILYYGKFLIVPLLFSLFFFIILKSLSIRLSSFKFIKIKYKVSFTLISLFFAFLIYFIGILLESNLSKVIQNAQLYQKNLSFIFDYIKDSSLGSLPVSFNQFILNINFANIFSKILNSLTGIASNFSLVIIYLIFIVLEENLFKTKILKLSSKKSTLKILEKINIEIFNYFQLKTLTSFLTGLLTFIVLIFFDNDLAIFFGILSFILNFIPFLGSLISIIFPFIFSLVQFLDLVQSTLLLLFLVIIQILVGNFLEPKLMGKSLNLSPIVMLISLSLMGKLWGISGMFLSIPILVVLLIFFSNFHSTKKIALLLSEKGEIN